MNYEDMRSDTEEYLRWLGKENQPRELASRVFDFLYEHVSVGNTFLAGLEAMPPRTLAIFIAANEYGGRFDDDTDGDQAWLEHCRERCEPTPHPSESAEQRNGGQVTFPATAQEASWL